MGIESPTTFGDYYWAKQLEAQKLFAEDTEKELTTMASRLMGSLKIGEILPDEFDLLFRDLEAPAGFALGDIGGRFVSEVADGAVTQAASPFFESMGYLAYMRSPTKKLTPQTAATLFSRRKISEELFNERFRMGGFEPIEAKFIYDSLRPYPAISDLTIYSRYHGDPDNVWTTLQQFYDIDPVMYPVWEWLTLQRLTTGQAQILYKRNLITSTQLNTELSRIGWSAADRPHIEELGWIVPNAMLMVQGGLMAGRADEELLKDISIADVHPKFTQTYMDAVLTKPSTADIIAYELRRDPGLSRLPAELRKIGVHGDYTGLLKELAYQIPPVGDIITMAVREAFTPAIAERFGQYEDFPAEFAEWAAKKGLSPEWSKRYWASHWSLPSAQQGFEMLHRGVIDQGELNMLLRALDIMPFWREKLTKVAYRRLTRVDVRRMYRVGVLDEAGVYEAYLELGYNERDAKRMTDFTVKQALEIVSKFSSGDIISAYVKRMLDASEARSLLTTLGMSSGDISFVLSTADYKRAWAFTDNQIAGIRNLYRKKVYDANKARAELLQLDLPAEQVDVLMQQWYYEVKAEIPKRWTTAQVLAFVKAELISKERGIVELDAIGYDGEHIDVYIKSME